MLKFAVFPTLEMVFTASNLDERNMFEGSRKLLTGLSAANLVSDL